MFQIKNRYQRRDLFYLSIEIDKKIHTQKYWIIVFGESQIWDDINSEIAESMLFIKWDWALVCELIN